MEKGGKKRGVGDEQHGGAMAGTSLELAIPMIRSTI
jgi:hypothetical protein